MSQAYIKQIVTDVITRFQTRNPAEIARALEIGVKYADIGALKGFYTVIMETPFIVLNQNISEEEQRTILAHELGHHLLHEHLVQQDGIRETVLYDLSSQPEYEANVFSAHLLLDPKQITQLAQSGYTYGQIAAALRVEQPLLELYLQTSQGA